MTQGAPPRADLLQAMVRWRWPLLVIWTAVWSLARIHVVGDWPVFEQAARLLGGAHPLSMYARAPQIQVGPLAIVASLPLIRHPLLAQLLLNGLGLIALRAVELSWPTNRPGRLLVGGLLTMPCWTFIATSGHLDDALVLVFLCLAALAITRDSALVAGLLTGAAIAAKPWALVALPLVLGVRAGRGRAIAAALIVPAAWWLPFVLGDPHTLSALASFHIAVSPTSGLHLLGITGAGPAWVRPVQTVAGLLLAGVAVRRGRWWAVPAAGLAARVALDPGSMGYYAAGLAMAVLLADGWSARRIPTGPLLVCAGLFGPAYATLVAIRHDVVLPLYGGAGLAVAGLRVAACLGAVAVCLAGRLRPTGAGADTDQSGIPDAAPDQRLRRSRAEGAAIPAALGLGGRGALRRGPASPS